MRAKEFVEGALGAINTVAPELAAKSIEHSKLADYLEHHPFLEKLVSASPSAKDAVEAIAMGENPEAMAIVGLLTAVAGSRVTPEFKQIVSWMGSVDLMRLITPHLGTALKTMKLAAIPAELLALPYMAASVEKRRIAADPKNPAYDNIPYAQSARTDYKQSQGAAGAANARNALRNFSTAGNPSRS
jgi:hypothetical protein